MIEDTSEKEKFKPFMPQKAQINAEWMGNLKKSQANPTEANQVYRDEQGRQYKRCQCCSRIFYPSPGHESDQHYCKDPECQRQRTNYRARKQYRKDSLDPDRRELRFKKKHMERMTRALLRGLEPPTSSAARKRNGMRRTIFDQGISLLELWKAFKGMLVALGHKTADAVIEKIRQLKKLGEELIL